MKDIRIIHDSIGCYAVTSDPREQRSVRYWNDYFCGRIKPFYPMPAIPLAVKYDYVGCVNIDDVSNPDDPVIVWLYDSWTGQVQ